LGHVFFQWHLLNAKEFTESSAFAKPTKERAKPMLKKPKIQVYIPTDEEDEAITAAAMSDPDALPWTEEQLEVAKPSMRIGRPPLENPKISTTIRLDADIVGAFKATGPGWQPRINTVLREAVEQGRV